MTGDSPTGPLTELDTGEVLNASWRLDELIGAGGMGRVFRATDLKLARRAAVKALSVRNLDDETLKRFERESQVMGKLNHPGVVTLYGVGRTRGVPWIAMRHLDGTSLWGVLDKHLPVMTAEVLLPIVRQLCAALGYIHERGLIHRDLKPSNIHVGPDGRTTLLDLGLARGRQTTLTRTGVVWGTPEYMSPEQILAERQLDGRSDLYALAIIVYRMMAGQLPFPQKEDAEVMRAHLTAPRPDISRLRPELSVSLGAALQKGLAIHPEDRFQSAAQMLAALEHALAARPREAATAVAVTGRPIQTEPHRAFVPERAENRTDPAVPAVPPDVTPKGRRITAEELAPLPDLTPKGRKITGEALAPPVAELPPDITPRGLSLLDDDDGASASTQREGFVPIDTTRPEGFEAIARPSQTLVEPDSGPGVAAPRVPVAQLPVYLTPPYLVVGGVVLLLLGVLLGKVL